MRHLLSWNLIRVPRQTHACCRCKFGSKYSSNVWALTAHHFVLFWSRALLALCHRMNILLILFHVPFDKVMFSVGSETRTHSACWQAHMRTRYGLCVNFVVSWEDDEKWKQPTAPILTHSLAPINGDYNRILIDLLNHRSQWNNDVIVELSSPIMADFIFLSFTLKKNIYNTTN